jgi:hypothetical protein
MESDLAKEIVSLVDANKELRKECSQQEDEIKIYNKKLNTLNRELDTCYKTLSRQDSTIIAQEEEIESLKSEIKSLKQRLYNVLQDLKHKDSACTAQDICILKLEDKIDQLRQRIKDLVDKKISQNNIPMAVNALFENIGTGLDQLEIYINGGVVNRDRPYNPANALNAIRITITTIRGHCENLARTSLESVRALNTHQVTINNLRAKTDEIIAEYEQQIQMLTLAWNEERDAHREEWEEHRETTQYGLELEGRIAKLLAEKFAFRLIKRRKERLLRQCHADKGLLEYNRDRLYDRYLKWKAKELNSRQIILNLQNNPLGNMADARRQPLYNIIGPIFAKHDQYTGQEPPNEYLDRIWNSISHLDGSMTALENANAGDFDNAIKCGLLKTKLGGKYIPVPNNDPYTVGNPAINTPATLRVWMNAKYQRETVGSQQSAIQRLSQERFLPTDSPDTYEKRIRPLLLGVPNNDATALSFLKNHLSGDFYTWMKIANPANIDVYFTELKNLWLERHPVISSNGIMPIQQSVESLPIPKKDDFKTRLAKDLQYDGIAWDDETLEKFIYEDLTRRFGHKTAHIRKSPFAVKNTYATKKVVRKVASKSSSKQVRHCSVCGKIGHTKVSCPKIKKAKKVNYIYQTVVDDPECLTSDEEYITEEEESEEFEEVEEDETDDEQASQRNCNALKKKW